MLQQPDSKRQIFIFFCHFLQRYIFSFILVLFIYFSTMYSEASNSERSMSVDMYQIDKDIIYHWDEKMEECYKILEIDNVRITPPVMIFSDAFEGRKYKQKLVIQNCGKSKAFIRICPSTSSGFKIDTIVRGQDLSPGLSIKRSISYTYLHASVVRLATFPIHINDKRIDYRMVVTLSSSIITAEPKYLDFGRVDAGHAAATRTLLLKNDGTKDARFAIDLGDNKLDLIVYPHKGLIQAKSEVVLYVEVKSLIEGYFLQEFWIKTEPPLRIQVTVNFVEPKFVFYNADTCTDFTIIDFQRAYFGMNQIKSFIIRNDSAIDSMFCIMAEVQKKDMLIKEAAKVVPDFRCFHISDQDGRLKPNENRILEIVFTPKMFPKSKSQDAHDDYAIAMIRIMRVCGRDIWKMNLKKEEENGLLDISVKDENADDRSKVNGLSITSLSMSLEERMSYPPLEYIKYDDNVPKLNLQSGMKRILLYGIFEKANMGVRPDYITINDMNLNKSETRVLMVTNHSPYLPIIFKYRKVANVEVKPQKSLLKPLERFEVSVKLTPTKLGQIKTAIIFDLLYSSSPKDENTHVPVGYSVVSVLMNVTSVTYMPKPRCKSELITYITHDTENVSEKNPKKAKGYTKNTPDNYLVSKRSTKNITPKQWKGPPMYKDWYFTGLEVKSQKNFEFRSKSEITLPVSSVEEQQDYDVSKKKHALLEFPFSKTCVNSRDTDDLPLPSFIPLTPTQLYEIKVNPHSIDLGRIAVRSHTTESFILKNNNEFSIRIFLKSQDNVRYPKGNRKTIKGNSQAEIKFTYYGNELGKHNLTIDVLINECHCLEVSVTVDVAVRSVRLSTREIIFVSNEDTIKFVDLTNILNVPIYYTWDTPTSCFTIEPISGFIESKCTISCMVSFTPQLDAPIVTEFTVMIENGGKEPLKLLVILEPPLVTFEANQFVIDHIPLNIPIIKKFHLKNVGYETISFLVSNPEPYAGIKIAPVKGTFRGKSDQVFTIYMRMKACVQFKCIFVMQLQRVCTIKIELCGTVDYPDVVIQPENLKFRKIVLYAFDRIAFLLQNRSQLATYVKFNFEQYPGYFVSESFDVNNNKPLEEIVLDADQNKQLFLHFKPIDVASYKLLLPIVLNNILGPPNINNPDSLNTCTYLLPYLTQCMNTMEAEPLNIPETLPVVNIDTSVVNTFLQFSTYNFDFLYYPHKDYECKTERELTITNLKDNLIEFCIRTSDLDMPFFFSHINGGNVEEHECSIICRLNPKEHAVFKATFNPTNPGSYETKLAVYVRHYLSGSPFNYLSFKGYYPPAKLVTSKSCYYFGPVPVGCKSVLHITIKAAYHMPNCLLSHIINSSEVSVNFPNDNKIGSDDIFSEKIMEITYHAKYAKVFETSVTLSCSCSASTCTIDLKGASENCIITTHAALRSKEVEFMMDKLPAFESKTTNPTVTKSWLQITMDDDYDSDSCDSFDTSVVSMVNFNVTGFPKFPPEYDKSEFAFYMRKCLGAVENWVCEQGFQGKAFYKIPEGIAAVTFKEIQKGKKNKKKTSRQYEVNLTYMKLLTNLAGPEVNAYVTPKSIPEDKLDQVGYILSIYKNVLDLLCYKGAVLPHVIPEHLLEYEKYCTFRKHIFPLQELGDFGQPTLNPDDFHCVSKQSWMDLILQTYKLFVLSRVRLPLKTKSLSVGNLFDPSKTSIHLNTGTQTKLYSAYSQTFLKVYENVIVPPQNIYSKSEIMLLFWLEYNFEQQRELIWSKPIESRNIKFFDKDLKDSIVLATATAAYCPYLVPYLKDFYLKPNCYEQLFHNAVQLIKAWKKIEISFSLLPSQIVEANLIQMILLVNYLYDFLPGFYPNETIVFKVPHTQTAEKMINIANNSNNAVAYKVVLFNNDNYLFDTNTTLLNIPAEKEKAVKITFNAKFLMQVKTYLVLCGDVRGYYYSKSIAFTLEGIPDITYINNVITFQVQLYQVFESTFCLRSPYEGESNYDIYFVNKSSDTVDTLHHMPWSNIRHCKLPRRIYNLSTIQHCDQNGLGVCTAILCPLVPKPKDVIMYFLNSEIGDFSLKCTFDCHTDVGRGHYETLEVILTRDLDKQNCECQNEDKVVGPNRCPKKLPLRIPYRNNLMWKCVAEMIMSTIEPHDASFWEKYLGTSTGFHILHYIFQADYEHATKDIVHIFRKQVVYKVIPMEKPTPSATLPENIAIDNALADGRFEIPIHVNTERPNDFFFVMESHDGKELRFYKIAFISVP